MLAQCAHCTEHWNGGWRRGNSFVLRHKVHRRKLCNRSTDDYALSTKLCAIAAESVRNCCWDHSECGAAGVIARQTVWHLKIHRSRKCSRRFEISSMEMKTIRNYLMAMWNRMGFIVMGCVIAKIIIRYYFVLNEMECHFNGCECVLLHKWEFNRRCVDYFEWKSFFFLSVFLVLELE